MSAERQSPNWTAPSSEDGQGLAIESTSELGQETVRSEPALHARIERTKLQAKVRALERTLETSERQRAAIVTQYERLLEERMDEVDASETGLLSRLLERWRGC